MDVLKNQSQCPWAVVSAIVSLTAAALVRGGRREGADVDDIGQIVDLLHLLRPDNADFSFFDGCLLTLRGEWRDAEAIFRGLVERGIYLAQSKSVLLRCLMELDVYGWQDEARALVEEGGDDEAIRVAKILLASDDLKHAAATARRTGRFVEPGSVRELREEAETAGGGAVAAPSQSLSDMPLTMQYLRI
ncbi:HrpB1 family type III secretion system apparatus protein [Paraburkholderia sp. SARCC-3016]|uniref:HrpB1 family type III secretion system apparatus protein n=1 Tax=Paraburkholderia sp. SARCC-3016 TaxID=3058611 RepID=UPI00280A0E36|nr:HrpB1 family type III secretion system apparatus protein [Paraburkholderia sp. SARCC-3016]MDQ7980265.1 HrpB1 family type III secretion system apparatus protein [Paraburkholderia sp. SARCC-3016]